MKAGDIQERTSPFVASDSDRSVNMLSGQQVKSVSGVALERWDHLLLVEDDAARAARRGRTGVAERSGTVLVRLHRIGRSGLQVVDERIHVVGGNGSADKSALALGMLDGRRTNRVVVVAGTSYGSDGRFLDGILNRPFDFVVEIRPSTRVFRRWDHDDEGVLVSNLIDKANWMQYSMALAGVSDKTIRYSIARLGAGYLTTGHHGTFFAIETGAINGVHRGTVFGFTQAEEPKSRELIEAIGWARWIRPVVRRHERESVGSSVRPAVRGNSKGNGHVKGHAAENIGSRLRANIKLSTLHDKERASAQSQHLGAAPLKGALASATGGTANVIELFAGAGGMGLGFLLAGSDSSRFRILHSGEVDPIYVNTLNLNHAEARRIFALDDRLTDQRAKAVDLRDQDAKRAAIRIAKEAGGTHVLIGGPPCQGFSNSNRNSWHSANPNNQLVDVYLDYVEALKPQVFVMENVQGITWTGGNGVLHPHSSVLEHVKDRTAAAGYEVFVQLLDSVWYGVPQCRSRFFVVGLHREMGYCADDFGTWGPFPRPTHGPGTEDPYVTVRDAIGDLPAVGNGSNVDETVHPEPDSKTLKANPFLWYLRKGAPSGVVTDHVTSRHADYVIERYRRIPPGGNWESIVDTLTNYSDVGRTHSNIYRRLVWGEPSITIGHYRKSMTVHPGQDRGLSLREAARLQSFPDWFRFAGSPNGGSGGLVHKQQQLANAVSPLVSRAIADFLLRL